MISSNALSLFLLNNNQNGVYNRNISLIKYLMRLYKPTGTKFKHVCVDFGFPKYCTTNQEQHIGQNPSYY